MLYVSERRGRKTGEEQYYEVVTIVLVVSGAESQPEADQEDEQRPQEDVSTLRKRRARKAD